MKTLFLAIIVLVISISTLSAQTSLRPGNDAPVFAASSMDGSLFDLDGLRGSVVVVTFWSTRCEICRAEIPTLNRLSARYDQRKVVFLAPTMESEDRVMPFLEKHPFGFQVLPNSLGVVLKYADRDRNGNIDMAFPSYFLIDTDGKLAYRTVGWSKTKDLALRIDQLLDR